MKPISESQRQFIVDTLIGYKDNPDTCGYGYGHCLYLTHAGKKCAVGKHMKEGDWQCSSDGIVGLTQSYSLRQILTAEAFNQNLNIEQWSHMQSYHDCLALGEDVSNILTMIETVTGTEFPELE